MTLSAFSEIFALLAVQLRATDVDEATIRGYFQALKDLDLELVAMAATRMAQAGGALEGENRHWFPKTSEWRAMTGKIEGERAAALTATIRELHKQGRELCAVCEDTGWKRVEAGNNGGRTRHCECRKIRRMEILGIRPMPRLLSGTTNLPTIPVDVQAITASVKGMP